MLQKYLIDVAIPHQSQIGFEEPICDSFPPGEAFGAFLNCKINYNLHEPNGIAIMKHNEERGCFCSRVVDYWTKI